MAKEVKNWKTSTVYQSFYSTVLSYCMKCRKNTKSKTKRVAKTNKKNCFYQNLKFVAVIYQDSSKRKKSMAC